MNFIQVCLIVVFVLNVVSVMVAIRSDRRPSRWTDVSAAVGILCIILYACGVR